MSVCDGIGAAIRAGVARSPQFEIVGSVHGDRAQDAARGHGHPHLVPGDIVGVVTQGRADQGAGREMPTIIMGNRQDEPTRRAGHAGGGRAASGHDGAGRSMLADLLTRALPPSEGRVRVDRAVLRNVAQDRSPAPNLSVAGKPAVSQRDRRGWGRRRSARPRPAPPRPASSSSTSPRRRWMRPARDG